MIGFYTLFLKEWLRFWKVAVQTVLAPVLTALLYLFVFAHTLRGHVEVFPGVDFASFLIPGLAMMAVLQNAFANSSSSLMQSKMQGNIVFVLLPPISHREFFMAYLLAAMGRGLTVGAGMFLLSLWFVHVPLEHPLWALVFAIAGSGVMGALGIVAGMQSEKVDELSVFTNFIILPLTFLAGGVLFDPLAAAVLAKGVVSESDFLHDRRLSLRLFRPWRRVAVGESGHCVGGVRGHIIAGALVNQDRL